MTVMIRILLASCMLLPMVASGQQPGTPQYNSVFLPGHGVGDTARSSVNRWGAGREGAIRRHWAGLSQGEASRRPAPWRYLIARHAGATIVQSLRRS